MKRLYILYYLLLVIFIFALSFVYEFWLEDSIVRYILYGDDSNHLVETTTEHFEYIFTVTIFMAIVLPFPVFLAYRLNVKQITAEIEKFKLKTQLLHADKLSAIGRLTASIAHEFKNPMIVVTNFITRLNKKPSLTEGEAQFVSIAEKECHRMLDFIEKLQDFNRPTSGQPKPVNLHECLNNTLLISNSELRKKNISLEKDFAENLPAILLVRDQICQVFLNLINNAIDACEDGGKIKVATNRNGESIVLRVQDNGKGIKKDDMAQIFEPFFTTKPERKGTGLGLYVSLGIIKDHGGTIEVESREGEGTTFSVTLPVSKNLC